jgi:PIN domain nuclease of toxin-antitoxin system
LRLLLDTHVLVWYLIHPDRLPASVSETLVDPGHTVYVSAASTWEAAIKGGLGRLSLPFERLEQIIADSGFTTLSVTIAHSLGVRQLPAIHRDPFDRLLIAQARHEGLTLVTRNRMIRRYPVGVLWD